MGADPAHQLAGVTAIRRLLSKESRPPVEPVVQAGALPRLVELLASPDSKIQFEAAWAITNIASTEHTSVVVRAGAIPALVQGMMASDAQVRDQCIWCLGNVAGDCVKYRDMLFATPGAVQALLLNIQHPETPLLLQNATWTLSNFCRGKPSPPQPAVAGMLPALAYLLRQADSSVLADAAWGISYLTDNECVGAPWRGGGRAVRLLVLRGANNTARPHKQPPLPPNPPPPTPRPFLCRALIQTVVDSGVLPRVVELMGHPETNLAMPALRIVGNVISGTDVQTQAAVDAGALRALVPLLGHARKNIRREACWAVSNVAAGTPAQISALMMVPGLVGSVIAVLKTGEWNVRREAAWVVSNITTTGTPAHAAQLVSAGVIDALVEALGSQDARMLCVVLDAVGALLAVGKKLPSAGGSSSSSGLADAFEEAGLLQHLESLQDHEAEDVYRKCVRLIEEHYGADEEGGGGDENGPAAGTAPGTTAGGAFSFGLAGAPAAGLAPTQLFASPSPAASSGGGSACGPLGGFAAGAAGVPPAPTAPPAVGGFNFSGGFSFA